MPSVSLREIRLLDLEFTGSSHNGCDSLALMERTSKRWDIKVIDSLDNVDNSYLVLEPSWCSVPRKVAEVAQPVPV